MKRMRYLIAMICSIFLWHLVFSTEEYLYALPLLIFQMFMIFELEWFEND